MNSITEEVKLDMATQKRHQSLIKLYLPTKTYSFAQHIYFIQIEIILELNPLLEKKTFVVWGHAQVTILENPCSFKSSIVVMMNLVRWN